MSNDSCEDLRTFVKGQSIYLKNMPHTVMILRIVETVSTQMGRKAGHIFTAK